MGRPPTSRVGNMDATSRISCPMGCPTCRVNFVSEDKLCNTMPTLPVKSGSMTPANTVTWCLSVMPDSGAILP